MCQRHNLPHRGGCSSSGSLCRICNPAQQDTGATYMELVDYQQWLHRQLEKISGIFLKKYPHSVAKIASKRCNSAT